LQFTKLFSGKIQNEIDQFLETNQINFNGEKDLFNLVDCCNSKS
jgi:hypothetical protein